MSIFQPEDDDRLKGELLFNHTVGYDRGIKGLALNKDDPWYKKSPNHAAAMKKGFQDGVDARKLREADREKARKAFQKTINK